jgi:hypothetical protein
LEGVPEKLTVPVLITAPSPMMTGCVVSTGVMPDTVPGRISVPLFTVVTPLRVFEPDRTRVPLVVEVATASDELLVMGTRVEVPPEDPESVNVPPLLTVVAPVNVFVAVKETFAEVVSSEPVLTSPAPVEIPALGLAMSNVPDRAAPESERELARLGFGPKILTTP